MDKNMSYEEASKKLDEIVRKMEDKDTTLDESMQLYEQAYILIAYCQKKLEEARGKIFDVNDRIAKIKSGEVDLFED